MHRQLKSIGSWCGISEERLLLRIRFGLFCFCWFLRRSSFGCRSGQRFLFVLFVLAPLCGLRLRVSVSGDQVTACFSVLVLARPRRSIWLFWYLLHRLSPRVVTWAVTSGILSVTCGGFYLSPSFLSPLRGLCLSPQRESVCHLVSLPCCARVPACGGGRFVRILLWHQLLASSGLFFFRMSSGDFV